MTCGASGISGQRYALFPHHLGSDGHAGVGVSVGKNGISVYEHAADYLPAMLVDDCPLSGWNHIAVVYRAKQPSLYLNGVYEKAGCRSTKTVHPAFDLGGSSYGWYDGILRDVGMSVTSASRAQQAYTNAVGLLANGLLPAAQR